jgi:CRISPR-associated endonuclease/helicase Cas3
MLVTFISQCEKKALNRTRRILDAFANRIGDNVWQTAITEDGLDTVKKLLRQSATKSTAVSCHRVRTRQRFISGKIIQTFLAEFLLTGIFFSTNKGKR